MQPPDSDVESFSVRAHDPRREHSALSRFRAVVLLFLWIIAIALAATIDRPVAYWVQAHRPLDKPAPGNVARTGNHPVWITRILRLPGNYAFVAAAGVAVGVLHRKRWSAAVPILLAGPLVGASYLVLKWVIGRRRPVIELSPFTFHPFINGLGGLVHSVSGLAFPSGDATMAFAAATCMSAALPRATVAFFAWAVIVAAERVLENAHYLSDVTAGAGLGVLCGLIALRVSRRVFTTRQPKRFDVTPMPR